MRLVWSNYYVIAIVVLTISATYYTLLSVRHLSWIFASGDMGDWLTASALWVVPQPPGSPLYIILGHLLALLPGDLVTKMTLLLSVLPGAVTVAIVYLVVFKQTKSKLISTASATILLGCGVFLSQASILEEYSIAVMFLTLGFYCNQHGNRELTVLFLALGTAVHVVVLVVALLWLFVIGREEARQYLKLMPIFVLYGILPYTLILAIMAWSPDPPFFAGWGLSVTSVREYLSTAGVAGTITILDFPKRLWDASAIVTWSFGLALIPMVMWLWKTSGPVKRILAATILFPLWYYLTAQDPTTWTYLAFAAPVIAIGAGFGIANLSRRHVYIVGVVALGLVIANVALLNANSLDNASPNARECYQEVMAMPDGSAVLTERGGFDTFAVFYAMSQGKDVVPVFFGNATTSDNYRNYTRWLLGKFGIEGSNDAKIMRSAAGQGRPLFLQRQRLNYADGLGVAVQKSTNQYFVPVTAR